MVPSLILRLYKNIIREFYLIKWVSIRIDENIILYVRFSTQFWIFGFKTVIIKREINELFQKWILFTFSTRLFSKTGSSKFSVKYTQHFSTDQLVSFPYSQSTVDPLLQEKNTKLCHWTIFEKLIHSEAKEWCEIEHFASKYGTNDWIDTNRSDYILVTYVDK